MSVFGEVEFFGVQQWNIVIFVGRRGLVAITCITIDGLPVLDYFITFLADLFGLLEHPAISRDWWILSPWFWVGDLSNSVGAGYFIYIVNGAAFEIERCIVPVTVGCWNVKHAEKEFSEKV